MASKRILVTGGAGFIGTHLCVELIQAGHRVRVIDNFSPQVHGLEPIRSIVEDQVEVIRGDVRFMDTLRSALDGIDVVYHLAASVGVGQSMYEVRDYTDNNNVGTATLLQLLIERPVERLVVASSMSIYGEGAYRTQDGSMRGDVRRDLERLRRHEWDPRDEAGATLVPLPTPETKGPDLASVYALSKFDQERLCLLVGNAYSIPTVALRFFNVYGPGQSLSNPYTGVMAIFGSRLLNGSPPLIYEDGAQLRDFVHVSDVARACVLALDSKAAVGTALNIGSGVSISIREIAVRMARELGKEHLKPEITGQYRVGDVRHCFADISLARKLLHYEPRVNLREGIASLSLWLRRQTAIDRSRDARDELASRGLAI